MTEHELSKRLRIKAGMIEMGERIAWGSDSALMREAANLIDQMAAKPVPCRHIVIDSHVESLIEAAIQGHASTRDAMRWLVQQIAKPVPDDVRKDAERLDFLQGVARCDPKMDGNHVWWPLSWNTCQQIKGPNLREAIDAAIAAQGGQS
jgi:hypothetical protein